MKIKNLIDKLLEKYDECGNVDVKIVSDDYHLTLHNIEDVRTGTSYDHNVEIVITQQNNKSYERTKRIDSISQ